MIKDEEEETNFYALHNFCAGCAEEHVDSDGKILPKNKVSCECSCHEEEEEEEKTNFYALHNFCAGCAEACR